MTTFAVRPMPPTVFPTNSPIDVSLIGGGMRRGQLASVMGKAGSGKSLIVHEWMGQWLSAGHRVAAVSLESSAEQTLSAIRRHTNRGIDKLTVIDNVGGQMPLTVASLPTDVDVIVIDSVALMNPMVPPTANNVHLSTMETVKECFQFAHQHNILIVMVQQAMASAATGVPLAWDAVAGGCGQVDYCDYVFSVWKSLDRTPLDSTTVHARLGKNRYGPSLVGQMNI